VTQYILSEDADRDLDGIWDYIAEDNIDAADKWIGRLFDAFDAIGKTPGMGHKREGADRLPGSILAGGRLPHHLSRHVPARRDCGRDAGRARYSRLPAPALSSLIHRPAICRYSLPSGGENDGVVGCNRHPHG
jgi:plasmid stabilization system protein ParE